MYFLPDVTEEDIRDLKRQGFVFEEEPSSTQQDPSQGLSSSKRFTPLTDTKTPSSIMSEIKRRKLGSDSGSGDEDVEAEKDILLTLREQEEQVSNLHT